MRADAEAGRNPSDVIVVNATGIGRFLDGISVYALNILRELAACQTKLKFIIYVNRMSASHLEGVVFGKNCELRWVHGCISPDHGFRGQLLRVLFANWISLKHRAHPIFAASQIEACLFRRRQTVMVHDVIPFLFRRWHRKQYFFFRFVLPFILKRAEAIITPSYHTHGLLQHTFGVSDKKIVVIPNGVQREFSNDNANGDEKREAFILFTGRLTRMKNIDGLLNAFSIIQHSIPHKLVIVGHGKDNCRLLGSSRLKQLTIDPSRVVIKGSVSTAELASLYRRASVAVVPSFYEGFGLPPLEAMASGCPVVASNVASIPEVCGNAVYYVDPYVPFSIALGIFHVITNRGLQEDLSERGILQARRYRWKSSLDAHMRIFRKMVGSYRGVHEGTYQIPVSAFASGSFHSVQSIPERAFISQPSSQGVM